MDPTHQSEEEQQCSRTSKAFVLRGNVVDLAVGIVIGAAFGTVVSSLVKNVLTALVAIPGTVNFADLQAQVGGADILYGLFLNDLIAFLTIGAAVFFFVVRPVNSSWPGVAPSPTSSPPPGTAPTA